MDKEERRIKIENWVKNESGAEIIEFQYQWRLNGVVDVYKNGKTIFCMVDGKFQKNIESYELLISIVQQKLSKNSTEHSEWNKRKNEKGVGELITIYTDGAAIPNPGYGGYGIIMLCGEHKKILSGGFRKTTNNRMELIAVIIGLESIKKENSNVEVYSDSRYVVDSISKDWIGTWAKKNWKTKKKEGVANKDLWERLMVVYPKHSVTMNWIKGHNNNEYNEECDKIAENVVKQFPKNIDYGFENNIPSEILEKL